MHKFLTQSISDYYYNSSWHFTMNFCNNHWDIVEKILLYSLGPANSDTVIWPSSPSGKLSSKLAYDLVRKKHPTVSWGNWIWSSFIPPRKSLTVWRAINDKLPTWDKLHLDGPSICCLCFKSEENIDHLFVYCEFATQIWQKVFAAFNISCLPNSSFGEFVLAAMNLNFSPQILSLWRAVVVNVIWNIWNSRNKFIFEDCSPSTWLLTASLWADLQDTNSHSIGNIHNNMDDLLCLHNLRLRGHPCKAPRICVVNWNLPPPDWLKCNTDGSALGAPGPARCGGVFRNCRGFVLGCFSVSLGTAYAFEAELYAVILALEAAVARNWKKIWLECDSSYVCGLLLSKSSEVPWLFRNRWLNVLLKIQDLLLVVTHIFSEGNQVADALSKHHDSFHWSSIPPDSLFPLLARDLSYLPFYRFSF